ncbi:DUF642 domain-containing protein [Okeania sp. KiyG1]|uniref:DUF642 domain-containing protein n=1 Tax=Okeania sp. KiyG1 TaxID=2720165 RepID=UPI0019235B37|nr:DUF642 domain-containing protein [Okeania sp. KiyG1]GGA16848.1 hypothetical protein CYANOKiyG1_31010 [Okeania sp. KiyG1]
MKRILAWVMSVLLAFTCVNISPNQALAAETNLVVNGSFETPVVTNFVGFNRSITGWDLFAGPTIEINNKFITQPSDGSQVVELDSFAVSGIYQDIPTEAGKTYKLSFAFKANPNASENKLNVRWGDTVVANLSKTATDTEWEVYAYDLKATSNNTRLSFDNLNEISDAVGTFIDAVSLVETIAPDAPCDDGPKANLIDFNSAESLNAAAEPISSGVVTVSFEGLNVIEVGSSRGGFSGSAGPNQVISSDRVNFNGRFLTEPGARGSLRGSNYSRVIDFSQPVNNVCLFVADIDFGQGITLEVSNSKGESLYSNSFPSSTRADASLTTFDLSKLEGVKRIEMIGSDTVGIDNLSFN